MKKATAEQRHIWLRAATNVTVRHNGTIMFQGNRYHADFLLEHAKSKVTVRYDPENFHAALHVYAPGGGLIGEAVVIEKTGHNDSSAAAESKRLRQTILRGAKPVRGRSRCGRQSDPDDA